MVFAVCLSAIGPFIKLAAIMLWVGVLLVIGVVVAMAQVLLRPRRMGDGRALFELHRLSPEDLNLPFENESFVVEDRARPGRLKMTAWWIPQENCHQTIVLVHGYSDAKVGAIAWAPLLRELGFNLLVPDLRAHGESDGIYCTAGYWERHDLMQIIDQLRAAHPEQTVTIVLFGISLGAAVVAATAAMRNDLAAVVLECPFTDYRMAVRYQADRLAMPGPVFQNLMFVLAQWFSRADFAEVAPLKQVTKISCPLMVIQTGNDPFLLPPDFAAMQTAVETPPVGIGPAVPRVCWTIPNVHHVLAMVDNPVEYRRRLGEFLASALQLGDVLCNK